ncbi:hypothetical protein NE237_019115 [Protea cynaroides]|uniref:BHLH domain-containing protein n=1 Tax=Protea cynaroides TaxID=273540 RepID=A0A9Q0KBD7_9MAGN|nr:hypothetical protein NE237_019115 [Protea cynaroides]
MAQSNVPWEQQPMLGGEFRDPAMANDGGIINQQSSKLFHANGFLSKDSINHFPPWVSPMDVTDDLNLPWELPSEQNHHCSSPINFFGGGSGRHFPPDDDKPKDDIFFGDSFENWFQDNNVAWQQSLVTKATDSHPPSLDFSVNNENALYKDSIEPENDHENNSVSDCSDENEKVDLEEERKKREKHNEMLYKLRILVPKISKMDRASIVGDAVEFVKELQRKVKDLQDELEEPMEEDRSKITDGNNNKETSHRNGPNHELDDWMKSTSEMFDHLKITESVIMDDEAPKMEPFVEVTHIGAKKFFLRVFCEPKPGGFVKLMEAMNAMDLEVINVNVRTFKKLVVNFFKSGDDMVEAEHVRESLLKITGNPIVGGTERL